MTDRTRFTTDTITTKSPAMCNCAIQVVKSDFQGTRLYYSGNMIYYSLSGLNFLIDKRITEVCDIWNADIRYFTKDGVELISHNTLIMFMNQFVNIMNMTGNPDRELVEKVRGYIASYSHIYNTYCNSGYEVDI